MIPHLYRWQGACGAGQRRGAAQRRAPQVPKEGAHVRKVPCKEGGVREHSLHVELFICAQSLALSANHAIFAWNGRIALLCNVAGRRVVGVALAGFNEDLLVVHGASMKRSSGTPRRRGFVRVAGEVNVKVRGNSACALS